MKEFDVRSGGKKKTKNQDHPLIRSSLDLYQSPSRIRYVCVIQSYSVSHCCDILIKKNTIFNMFLHVSSFTNTRTDTTVCLAAYTLSDK